MRHTVLKLLFWLNYILLILYMSLHSYERQPDIESNIPLLLASLITIAITYISSCNIRDNPIISLFCGLLALDSWYILLSFEKGVIESLLFTALSPIIWYVSIRFILMFLFQGSGYRFRTPTNVILLVTCISSLVGIGISEKVFASLYGIQFLSNCFCFLFIILVHWKRIAFVLKSEWKCILCSVAVITTSFWVYYFITRNMQNHISNFGIYLPVLLFFMSIHGIMLKDHSSYPLSTIFSKKQTALIICLYLIILGFTILFTGGGYEELILAINGFFSFLYLCNIILGLNLKQGKNQMLKESKYQEALRQLQQEELLKTEFANYLHDEVLQDLLSVKNMMTKMNRPDIQEIIIETLEHLNTNIRKQMQDYHPVILRTLTAKENYENLMEAITLSFPQRSIIVSFDCSDSLFLVEPYHILIYRLLKELLTNVFKHSDGNRAWVMLMQENGIIKLSVSDNGSAHADCLHTKDKAKHKGIAFIAEQVNHMEGTMLILNNIPQGICIQITIPMKGDVSYQYFVS